MINFISSLQARDTTRFDDGFSVRLDGCVPCLSVLWMFKKMMALGITTVLYVVLRRAQTFER
jgi:hypothetical protein